MWKGNRCEEKRKVRDGEGKTPYAGSLFFLVKGGWERLNLPVVGLVAVAMITQEPVGMRVRVKDYEGTGTELAGFTFSSWAGPQKRGSGHPLPLRMIGSILYLTNQNGNFTPRRTMV